MAAPREDHRPAGKAELKRVVDLLGGQRILKRPVRDSLDAHEVIKGGLPGEAVVQLFKRLVWIQPGPSFENAVGMSQRTLQRYKNFPQKPLNLEQSSRAWKFAEVLAKATEVFGSQEKAEQWLERPAMGLNGRRPIDLLATPAGVEMVEDFLGRLEYGVYV
jgi:putative toxin-antitoxin system antitoxin component (TIGR02293 family)